MRTFSGTIYLLATLAVMAAPAEAEVKQTGRWTLQCDGKGTSCQSLKTACTNGGATYTPLKGGGGQCTVGAAAGATLAARTSAVAEISSRTGAVRAVRR